MARARQVLGPPWGSEASRRMRAAREQLLLSPHFDEREASRLVRPEIASSWRRSQQSGLDPGAHPTLPHDEGHQVSPRLVGAAIPVLEKLQPQLLKTAIVLTDASSWIVWRGSSDAALLELMDSIALQEGSALGEDVLGTNGVGTAMEVRAPLVVAGGEHYLEMLQNFTCTSMPLRDPLTKRLEGIISLTCLYSDTNGALLPLIAGVAREIESRLFEGSSTRERALFDAFVRLSRTPALAVASLNEDVLITNSQAAQLFEPADHALLWDWARRCVTTRRSISGQVTLSREVEVTARCSPVEDGDDVAGVAITMAPRVKRRVHRRAVTQRLLDSGQIWREVQERASRAAAMSDRVLVRGEHGAGKATLIQSVCAEMEKAVPLVMIDCGIDEAGHGDELITELKSVFGGQVGAVVLRHIDLLSAATASAVATIVEAFPRRLLLTSLPASGPNPNLVRLLNLVEVEIEVPALRDRRTDIPALTSSIIRELTTGRQPPRCANDVLAELMHYDWPGNVAELRRVLSTALINSRNSDIRMQDIPAQYRHSSAMFRPLGGLERTERDAILDALKRAGWNHAVAAVELGISRATIYRKVKQMGIRRPARSDD